MTTYCSPSISYVVGGADPINGNSYDQSSSPLRLLKALIFLSKVPETKTRFPAVAVAPPKFSVPVIFPFSFNFL